MAAHLLYSYHMLIYNEIIKLIIEFSTAIRHDIDLNVYQNLRHGFGLQLAVCNELPRHGIPPCFGGGLLHIRLLVLVPLPQVLLHLPYKPQLLHLPSTGARLL